MSSFIFILKSLDQSKLGEDVKLPTFLSRNLSIKTSCHISLPPGPPRLSLDLEPLLHCCQATANERAVMLRK